MRLWPLKHSLCVSPVISSLRVTFFVLQRKCLKYSLLTDGPRVLQSESVWENEADRDIERRLFWQTMMNRQRNAVPCMFGQREQWGMRGQGVLWGPHGEMETGVLGACGVNPEALCLHYRPDHVNLHLHVTRTKIFTFIDLIYIMRSSEVLLEWGEPSCFKQASVLFFEVKWIICFLWSFFLQVWHQFFWFLYFS